MKRKVLCLFAVAALVAAASTARAQSDEDTVGDYASSAPGVAVPAGHFALLASYTDAFLTTGPGGHRSVLAASLVDAANLPDKADDISDFYLLDIRRPADYAAGHIAGAVNVQFADVANPGVLAALPTDRPILVICYTGHTASVANAILGTLGYDAWTLKFGMTSWKNGTTSVVGINGAVVTGSNP